MKYFIVGRTASGKNYLSNLLQKKFDLKPVLSFTTRPRRQGETEEDSSHNFITNATKKNYLKTGEFDIEGEAFGRHVAFNSKEIMAYTEINGHAYFATKRQLEHAHTYIIDPIGLKELLPKLNPEEEYKVFYIYTPKEEREKRFIDRDSRSEHEDFKKRCEAENDQFAEFEDSLSQRRDVVCIKNNKNKTDEENFGEVFRIIRNNLFDSEADRFLGILFEQVKNTPGDL